MRRHVFAVALVSTMVFSAELTAHGEAEIEPEKICKQPNSEATNRYLDALGSGGNAIPFSLFLTQNTALSVSENLQVSCEDIGQGRLPGILIDHDNKMQVSADAIASACDVRNATTALLTWPEVIKQTDDEGRSVHQGYAFNGKLGPCPESTKDPLCAAISAQRTELEERVPEAQNKSTFWFNYDEPEYNNAAEGLIGNIENRPNIYAADHLYWSNSSSSLEFKAGFNRQILTGNASVECARTLGGHEEPSSSSGEITLSEERKDTVDETRSSPAITIAKNLPGLRSSSLIEFNDRTKSSYAELSATINNEEREDIKDENGDTIGKRPSETVSFNGAIGIPLEFNSSAIPGPADLLLTPYISLAYKENEDPSKETDNLQIGVEAAYHFDDDAWLGPRLFPRLNISYVTDIEERESEQFYASITSNVPYLETIRGTNLFILDSYRRDHSLYWSGSHSLSFGWEVDGVIDYSDVVDAGDKFNLFDFTRIGYDLNGTFKFFPDEQGTNVVESDKWSFEFDIDYRFRDVVSGGARNADLIETSLSYKPASSKNLSYGLTYRRGENILSLEDLENWELGLKIRN